MSRHWHGAVHYLLEQDITHQARCDELSQMMKLLVFRKSAHDPGVKSVLESHGIVLGQSDASSEIGIPANIDWSSLVKGLEAVHHSSSSQAQPQLPDRPPQHPLLQSDPAAIANSSADPVSKYQKAMRQITIHINKDVVRLVVDELFGKRKYQACTCKFPGKDTKLDSNLVILTAPTQNGKTLEMLALSWRGFFEFGLQTYLFVRSDATAYGEIKKSVDDFNKWVTSFLDEKILQYAQDARFHAQGVDVKTYLLNVSVLSQDRQLRPEQVSDSLPTSAIINLKPLIRTRLLQAKNIENSQVLENELSLMVRACGVSENGDQINVIVMVDESQNTRQTFSLNQKNIECNLFLTRPRQGMLESAEIFCDQYGLQETKAKLKIKRSLRDIAALYVEVSATPEPTFLLEPQSRAQILECVVNENYFGFGDKVNSFVSLSKRPIHCPPLQRLTCHLTAVA
jgi:hypothetical protein